MEDRKHLTRERLASLWNAAGGQLLSDTGAQPDEMAHVASCEACRREWQALSAAAQDLKPLPAVANHERAPGCPAEERLRALAGGGLAGTEADTLLEHAAQCDHCGSVLRNAAIAFHDEITPEEQQAINAMRSTQPGWQKQLAAQLSATPRAAGTENATPPPMPAPRAAASASGGARARSSGRGWALAAAAVVVLVVGAAISWRATREPDVNQLLALAYTERRPMELRIAGAEYAPIRVERGPGGSTLDRPVPLSRAELIISEKLAASPSDPGWLAARGRAELLQLDYQAAEKTLRKALDFSDSPEMRIDLASAYLLHGQMEDNPYYFGKAIEELGGALGKQPDHAVALFNLAIAKEKQGLLREAAADWEHYLRIDPAGLWAGEARDRLQEVRKKIAATKKSSAKPQGKPEEIALLLEKLPAAEKNTTSLPIFDEDLLQAAVESWLPSPKPSRQAVTLLAQRLEQRHQDSWLRELLAGAQSAEFSSAMQALAAAIRSNQKGNPSLARTESRKAQTLFQESGNYAGFARARVEEGYALHRSANGQACLEVIVPLWNDSRGKTFSWIRGQAGLEKAICEAMLADFAAADRTLRQTAAELQAAGYRNLNLRGMGIRSGFEISRGNLLAAWKIASEGLQEYWTGGFAPERGYQFCADLANAAEFWGFTQLGVAVLREGVALLTAQDDRPYEGMARHNLGQFLLRAGKAQEASAEFEKARNLMGSRRSEPVSEFYRLDGLLSLALEEVSQGRMESAERRIQDVEPQVANTRQFVLPLRYFIVQGEINLRRGRLQPALDAFERAAKIARQGAAAATTELDRARWAHFLAPVRRGLAETNWFLRNDPARALAAWTRFANGADSSGPAEGKGFATAKQETRITLAAFRDGVAIWKESGGMVRSRFVSVQISRLRQLAEQHARRVADLQSGAVWQQTGAELFAMLFGEEAVAPAGHTLLLDLDPALGHLIFETLIAPDGAILGAQYSMAYLAGRATSHQAIPGRDGSCEKRPISTGLLVAAPAGNAIAGYRLPFLESAVEEVHEIARVLPQSKVLAGKDARREKILTDLRGAELFHFAGHAVARQFSPLLVLDESSGGTGESVDTQDILKTPLDRCGLVVLSACSTGRTDIADITLMNGFAQPFLQAGARRVIASRWPTDSVTTRKFMHRFYQEIAAGKAPGDSLHRAAQQIRSAPESQHPYYWAAFASFQR